MNYFSLAMFFVLSFSVGIVKSNDGGQALECLVADISSIKSQ